MKKTVHVVGAIMENEQGEIFCAKRSATMTLPNYWEFPGGKLESEETKEEALAREIQEELGCEIQVGQQVEDTTYEYDSFIVRLETFKAKIIKGDPILLEHAEAKWLKKEQLHEVDWAPADIPAVKKLQEGR